MIDEHGTTKEDRALMLAATMVEVMRERYDLPDEEINVVLHIALQVFFLRELPNDDPRGAAARRIILEATHRLSGLVADIDDARECRTVQ